MTNEFRALLNQYRALIDNYEFQPDNHTSRMLNEFRKDYPEVVAYHETKSLLVRG